MDAAKVHKLRKSYPDHVPVICESQPFVAGEKEHKLIMPHSKTGAEFAQICRDKCPWAAVDSKVWIKSASGLKEVPRTSTVKSLDVKMYKGQDDVLYVKVENKQQVKAESIATKSSDSDEDMSKSVQEFKMNGPAKASCRISKVLGDGLDQGEKARRMREKYPDRVPVLVNQTESPGLPKIEKKLLVPRTMKVQDLRKCLPKHLKLQDAGIPWDKVQMLMAGDSAEEDQCMGPIYDLIVDDDDGGLHLTLTLDCEPAALVALAPELSEDLEPAVQAPSEREERLQMALVQAQDELQEARHLREVALEQCLQEEDRVYRAEQREAEALARLEEKENTVAELQKELNEKRLRNMHHQNDLDQEIEARNSLELEVQRLGEELMNKERLLSNAQEALRVSGRESSAAQEKNLALEEKLVALEKEKERCQMRLKREEESIMKLKDMCTQLKEKLAMREEAAKGEQDRFQTKLKTVEQNNEQLHAQLEAMAREKAALAEEVRAFKDKAAEKEKEEDLVLVGWNLEGTPVDSEECNQSAEGFQLVPP